MAKKNGNGEGSIYPHKKNGKKVGYRGAYWVQTAEGPKRRYVSGKDRDQVRRKLTEAMANRDKGFIYDDDNLTVKEYLDRWLSDSVRGTVRESTYSRDKYLVTNHIKPALGRLKLKNLNAPHLQGLYRDRLDSGLSGSTVQKIHHVLNKGLGQAVMWNLIPRNPADSVKAPTPTPKEMHPLSAHEARRLLEAARGDRLEALYVLAVHTGMRRGELLGLKWGDVDLENATVRVRRTLTRNGTGHVLGEPKTKKSRPHRTHHSAGSRGPQLPPGEAVGGDDYIWISLPGARPRIRRNRRRSHQPLQPPTAILQAAPRACGSASNHLQ